jgi:four helix bundle protein
MSMVQHFRELRVYRDAFSAAMQIFDASKSWPKEERYSLTDQIRRSSQSVCGNIAEAWRKRRYPSHFTSKLSDADSEAAETQAWLEFAYECGYIREEQYREMDAVYERICGGLVKMMTDAEVWCGPSTLVKETAAEYGTVEEAPHTPFLPHPHTHRKNAINRRTRAKRTAIR